ncbi:beta-ketoacyl synthase chain length factor [Campylobacter iguaniorum]|nr:beta-ketoacyl synthase chain length factor [Campylobacter iguaniorum]
MKFDIVKFGACGDIAGVDLSQISPLNRRKLSNTAKFIYSSILDFGQFDMPIVFASNFGEINRCIDLLSELSGSSLVSPNSFSASVLNAPVASIGILRQIHSPIYAISSSAPVEDAMICAISKLNEFQQICVIAYEEDALSEFKQCVAFIIKNGDSCELCFEEFDKNAQIQKENPKSTEVFVKNYPNNFSFTGDKLIYKWSFGQ